MYCQTLMFRWQWATRSVATADWMSKKREHSRTHWSSLTTDTVVSFLVLHSWTFPEICRKPPQADLRRLCIILSSPCCPCRWPWPSLSQHDGLCPRPSMSGRSGIKIPLTVQMTLVRHVRLVSIINNDCWSEVIIRDLSGFWSCKKSKNLTNVNSCDWSHVKRRKKKCNV